MPMMGWQSRTLAVAILLAVLTALAFLTVVPTIDAYHRFEDEIARKTGELERYSGLSARRESLKEKITARRQQLADDPVFLEGATQPLSAALLQEHVREAIERTGGDVQAIETLPAQEKRAALHQINVRVSVLADVRDVKEILSLVETGEPVLFIESVEVFGNLLHPDEGPRIAPDLRLRMHVSGYWQPPR